MNKTKEQWLDEALKFYKEKRYKETLEACEQAIQIDDKFTRALHGKGLALMKQKMYKEALAVYDSFLELDSNNAKAHCEKGEILCALGEFKEARESYFKAIQINEKYRRSYREKTAQIMREAEKLLYRSYYDEDTIDSVNDAISSVSKSMDIVKKISLFDPNNGFTTIILSELSEKKKRLEKMYDKLINESLSNKPSFTVVCQSLDPSGQRTSQEYTGISLSDDRCK